MMCPVALKFSTTVVMYFHFVMYLNCLSSPYGQNDLLALFLIRIIIVLNTSIIII